MATAIGLRAYTGWGVAVTLDLLAGAPQVTDRRRVALLPGHLPAEVYHAAHRLHGARAASLIEEAVTEAVAAARAELEALVRHVSGDGGPSAALVVKRGPPPAPPRHARMSHTGCHAAEGELFRYALLEGAGGIGLGVTLVPEAELEELACSILGLSPADLASRVAGMGAAIGPPWTQREKSAALAAWIALRQKRQV